MDGSDEWVKKKWLGPKLEMFTSLPTSLYFFPYCFSVGPTVPCIPGAVFCGNRHLRSLSTLEEEPAAGTACSEVGGGHENRYVQL